MCDTIKPYPYFFLFFVSHRQTPKHSPEKKLGGGGWDSPRFPLSLEEDGVGRSSYFSDWTHRSLLLRLFPEKRNFPLDSSPFPPLKKERKGSFLPLLADEITFPSSLLFSERATGEHFSFMTERERENGK